MPHVLNCELTFVHSGDQVTYVAGTPVEPYPCPPKKDRDGEAGYCFDRAAWLNKLEGNRPIYVAAVLDGRPRILPREALDQVATLPTVGLDSPNQVLQPVPVTPLF
jgi:hypothetical protein